MKKIPIFPDFKLLEHADRLEVEEITNNFSPYSDFNFTTLWCWDIHKPVTLSRIENNLIITQSDCISGQNYYSIIGKNNIEKTMELVIEFIETNNQDFSIKSIPEETFVLANNQQHLFVEDLNSNDYILSVDLLSKFEGNSFRQHRKKISGFLKSYVNHSVYFLDIKDFEVQNQLIKLFNLWEEGKSETENELKAFRKMLNAVNYFEISVLGVFVDDRMVAFQCYELINENYAICNFGKYDITINGVSSYILQQTAKCLAAENCIYINFQEDMGILGLRQYKQKLNPVKFLKKFALKNSI